MSTPSPFRPFIAISLRSALVSYARARFSWLGSPPARPRLPAGGRLHDLSAWSVGLTMRVLAIKDVRNLKFTVERGSQTLEKQVLCLPAELWTCQRQVGAELERLQTSKHAKLGRAAYIALQRQYTGDPEAMPTSIPESLLRVARVTGDSKLEVGDLLLAIEVTGDAQDARLIRLTTIKQLANKINELCSYEGSKLHCWVYRAGKLQELWLRAKRVML